MRHKKTDLEKHLALMGKYRDLFDQHKYLLNNNLTNDENIKILINKAIEIKGEAQMDYHRIIMNTCSDAYSEIKSIIQVGEWEHLIKCACVKIKNKLTEKKMDKLKHKINKENYINSLYLSFYNSFCERDELKVVKGNKMPKLKYDDEKSEVVKNLVNSAAKDIINEIDPKIKKVTELAKVAYFISNGECTLNDFATAVMIGVDWNNECTILVKLYKKFSKFNNLMTKYFPDIKEVFESEYNIHVTIPEKDDEKS